MKIKPPDYKYCPFCGKELKRREEEKELRRFCPFCRWTYYPHVATAAGTIIFRGKKVLLVKRDREPYKGTWTFPAGFLKYGETPEKGAVRETKEETGLLVKPEKLVGVFQVGDDARSPGHFVFFYLARVVSGKIKNGDKKENSAIGWFDFDHLPPIGWKAHQRVVGEVKKLVG